jgi:hypothetical protein
LKSIVIIIFTWSFVIVNASSDDSLKLFRKTEVYANSNFNIGSTHLPSNFFKKLYYGGQINNNDKGNLEGINNIQRSGMELDINIGTKFKNSKNDYGWYINYQSLITAGGKYNLGLFDLIFRGNTNIDEQLLLNTTAFHFRNHQLLHIGKFFKRFNAGITLGNILNESNGKFGDQDYLNFTNPYKWIVVGNPEIISTGNTSQFFKKNGSSFGLDFQISNPIISNKVNFDFQIKNLGIIYLHNNIKSINYDTSFIYSGLSLNQISNNDSSNSLFNNFSRGNSLENKILITPFEVNTNINFRVNKIDFYSGLYYRFNSQYLPKIYLRINYFLRNKFRLGGVLNYGGYNKMQLGFNSAIEQKKWSANLTIQNLIGFIPSFGKSFGIILNFSWKVS